MGIFDLILRLVFSIWRQCIVRALGDECILSDACWYSSPLTSTVGVLEREVQSHNHRLYSKCWLAVNHPSKLDSFSVMCLGNNISPSIGTPLLTKKKLLADSLMRKLEKKNILLQSYAYACTEKFKRRVNIDTCWLWLGKVDIRKILIWYVALLLGFPLI